MAADINTVQFVLRLCEQHDRKELHAYCNKCQKKICSSCIKEEHTLHDWEMIADILREKKRTLHEECKDISSKLLPRLKSKIDRFNEKIEEEDSNFKQNKDTLNISRQNYIDQINELYDEMIDECRQNSETAKQKYCVERDGLKLKVEYLDKITTCLDKDIDTLPDHDILDMENEMRSALEKALSYSVDQYTSKTMFFPSHIDVQTLRDTTGVTYSVTMAEENDVDINFESIQTIEISSEGNAWIVTENEDIAKLIDRTGTQLKNMNTKCSDLVISDSGNVALISFNKGMISILTQEEEKITEFDTKPLYPIWISKTEADEMLVTLMDNGDTYNLVPTSHRVVQRMVLSGTVLHSYEFQKDGVTRLFTLPMKTAENMNTDVCIINQLSDSSGELVVLYRGGSVNFTYSGDGQNTDNFLPIDVDCDSKSNILFSECYSRAIHMLSDQGMFLCRLCQYENFSPTAISVQSDNLWCGFHEGKFKVYKYKN